MPRPILILGPTAGGKSEFAVALAEHLHAHQPAPAPLPIILNADSMQVYRHMNAGTAKPSLDQRTRVTHHLIDIVDPAERFTVADWLTLAEPLLDQQLALGGHALVVGGTNLYLKALLEGLFAGPSHDPALRAQFDQLTAHDLHEQLARVDPAAAQRIHRNDRKKLTRALEVFHLTGQPLSAQQTQWAEDEAQITYRRDPILLGLDWPTEAINRRINARVKAMFEPTSAGDQNQAIPTESLPAEVRRLLDENLLPPHALQARQALGYKQVLEHFEGQYSLPEAMEKTKVLTRRFAKTQRTWLKRYRQVHWLPADQFSKVELVECGIRATLSAQSVE